MNASSLSFQDIILRLQQYWGEQGCVIMHAYDSEVGAGTFHTATHAALARSRRVAYLLCAALPPSRRRPLRREP